MTNPVLSRARNLTPSLILYSNLKQVRSALITTELRNSSLSCATKKERKKTNWFMEKEAENTLFRAEMAK